MRLLLQRLLVTLFLIAAACTGSLHVKAAGENAATEDAGPNAALGGVSAQRREGRADLLDTGDTNIR
jgi:hypothetical protein